MLALGSAAFAVEFSIPHATMSIYAVRSDTGEVVIDQNSDASLVPASCVKVVTTAAALHILGPEHRFETYLEYDGAIEEKILQGNLYIRGGGDPCLGSNRIPGSLSWKEQLTAWVTTIRKLGIRKIAGKVIGDATKWEKALAPPSWSWEDLGNAYGAGASALSFHENSYSLVFRPGDRVGEAAAILQVEPPISSLTLQNEVKTGPKGSGDQACIYGSEFTFLQFVRGTVPATVSEFSIHGAIPDPSAICADLLMKELEANEIAVERQNFPSQTSRVLFQTTFSPSLKEIIYWTNQKSINLYAEHLLKQMGMVVFHQGSTEAGTRAVFNFWKSEGIDLDGFQMVDGSGLSRKNLLTAKQLVHILLKMKKSDLFPIFFASLPKQEGKVRAKSGSMSLIKGYVGYVGEIVFTVLVNHCADVQLVNKTLRSVLMYLDQKGF